MKIVNFKKFLRSILIVIGLVVAITLILARSSLSHRETEFKTIYVVQGETLWSIASGLQDIDYYRGKDIRDIINDLVNINELDTKTLAINQPLQIPID